MQKNHVALQGYDQKAPNGDCQVPQDRQALPWRNQEAPQDARQRHQEAPQASQGNDQETP